MIEKTITYANKYEYRSVLIDDDNLVVDNEYNRDLLKQYEIATGEKIVPGSIFTGIPPTIKGKQVSFSIKFECEEIDFNRFEQALGKLLSSDSKLKISNEELNDQRVHLLNFLVTFKPEQLTRMYGEQYKQGAVDFFSKLEVFIDAVDKVDSETSIGIKFKSKDKLKENSYKLPNSPHGNAHLLNALKNFLFGYYENNPPFKYIKGLSPKINEEYINSLASEVPKVDLTRMDSFPYHFEYEVLQIIKTFKQFPSGNNPNAILTDLQAKFILRFRWLIDYDSYKKSKIIRPKFILSNYNPLASEVKNLRNQLVKFRKVNFTESR